MTINITWQRIRVEDGDKKAEISDGSIKTDTLWSRIFRLFESRKQIEEKTDDSRRIGKNEEM